MLPSVFQKFVEHSPIGVMAPAVVVNLFQPDRLDALLARRAQHQDQRTLVFSNVVELMHSVVLSVDAASNQRLALCDTAMRDPNSASASPQFPTSQ